MAHKRPCFLTRTRCNLVYARDICVLTRKQIFKFSPLPFLWPITREHNKEEQT